MPLFRYLQLPFKVDWFGIGCTYWLVTGAQSIFAATIICVIGFPAEEVLTPLLHKLESQKVRIILILAFGLVLWWQFTWVKAVLLTVDAVAVLEYCERHNAKSLQRGAGAVGAAALYLFLGIFLIGAYNLIIVSSRFFAAYDPVFYRLDSCCSRDPRSQRLSTGLTGPFLSLFSSSWNLSISVCLPKLELV